MCSPIILLFGLDHIQISHFIIQLKHGFEQSINKFILADQEWQNNSLQQRTER